MDRKIKVDKKVIKQIIDKGVCTKCGGTLSYKVSEMEECGKIMMIQCDNCGDKLICDLEQSSDFLS